MYRYSQGLALLFRDMIIIGEYVDNSKCNLSFS